MAVIRCAGAILVFACGGVSARAQSPDCQSRYPQLTGAQSTFIGQHLFPFRSSYSGPMSLVSTGDKQLSQSYGLYGGVCLGGGFDVYLDAEMIRGSGIGHASGLAAVTNGDVLRQGSVDLGSAPYVARAFVRWTRAFGGARLDTIARAPDDLPRNVSVNRLEITAGRLAATDFFDLNRYANSSRAQFMDWVLFQDGAWDYAADTRGYSNGVVAALINPRWTLRVGIFQMPVRANGNQLDNDLAHARGENIELTVNARRGAVVRVLAYLNSARMGRYAVANLAAATGRLAPDIVADDAPGRTKFGLGLNAELPLAYNGETGVFVRVGWNDGRNESFAFTEVDRHLSAGIQVVGASWSRPKDHLGIAVAADGISDVHQRYLAAGGQGFLLGDGSLRYGSEVLSEIYYRVQLGPYVAVSPDMQVILNPGYNRDRGPATVVTLRVSARY